MMRKSYGGGSSGGGSGEMIRSVGKAMRTRLNNFQENNNNYSPSSPTQKSSTTKTSKHALSSSSLSLTHSNNIAIVGYPIPSNNEYFDNGDAIMDDDDEKSEIEIKSEWECLENYYDYDPIFGVGVGVAPSTNEVQHALSSLQQALHLQSSPFSSNKELSFDVDKDVEDEITYASETAQRASSKSSNSDWLEPSMQPYERKLAQSPGWERVYDAFHLLESEPSVQRMVVSLSSDKAVWDAVLNNEAVREIRDSYPMCAAAAEFLPPSSDEKPERPKRDSNILKWIFDNMKAKLLEVLGTISQFVADMFKSLNHDKEEQGFGFTEKLTSSFLLTVVILLIVVVARGHKT